MLRDEKGSSRPAALLYILVTILLIYALVKTVPPFMNYYAMDDEVAQQLHLASINSDDMIIADLAAKARELDIPVDVDDIHLEHSPKGGILIHISWQQDVDYGYGFKRTFSFDVSSDSMKSKE